MQYVLEYIVSIVIYDYLKSEATCKSASSIMIKFMTGEDMFKLNVSKPRF